MKCRLLFILCLVFVVTGCGYNMAFTKGQMHIDDTKKIDCLAFRQNIKSIQAKLSVRYYGSTDMPKI